MKFDLPVKCGEMYIKFDENKKPEYGFKCNFTRIEEFVNFRKTLPEYIILPKFDFYSFVPQTEEEMNLAKQSYGIFYLQGNIYLRIDSFKDIKKAKIVVPFNTSVSMDYCCFDDGSEIEFIVPENLTLKQIYRKHKNSSENLRENWTLLADKNIKVNIDTFDYTYSCKDFEPKDNKYLTYKVTHQNFKTDEATK